MQTNRLLEDPAWGHPVSPTFRVDRHTLMELESSESPPRIEGPATYGNGRAVRNMRDVALPCSNTLTFLSQRPTSMFLDLDLARRFLASMEPKYLSIMRHSGRSLLSIQLRSIECAFLKKQFYLIAMNWWRSRIQPLIRDVRNLLLF